MDRDLAYAILVRYSDFERAEIDDEAGLEFVDAATEEDHRLIEGQVGGVIAIHGGESEIGAVAVGGVGDRTEGAVHVDPVELRGGGGGIVASDEEIHRVGFAGTEGRGELKTGPRRGGGRSEGEVVPARCGG